MRITTTTAAVCLSGLVLLGTTACGDDSSGSDAAGGGAATFSDASSSAPASTESMAPSSASSAAPMTSSTAPATSGTESMTGTESGSASSTEGATGTAGALTVPAAQKIVRTVLDPQSTPAEAAAVVDSDDPQIGTKLHGFATIASGAGYKPEGVKAVSVRPKGSGTANASFTVSAASLPKPAPLTFEFVKKDGTWKASEQSVSKLLSMGGGTGSAG